MALPETSAPAAPVFDPIAELVRPRTAPREAMDRLVQIHHETAQTAQAAKLLDATVGAGAFLMLAGCLALVFAGGAGLKAEFAWTLLVLAGVTAMLRIYIKSATQAFDRLPLSEAAKDLRAILFYTGVAWGAGAFLALGANPIPAAGLCFAIAPSLGLALLLQDRAGFVSFAAPVTAITAAAILTQAWNEAPAALALLLLAQAAIGAGLFLSQRPRSTLPEMLELSR